jgi:hypothetical protein
VQRLANTLAFERRCIRSSFVAQVRRTLPVRLHLRALLARRISTLDASGYLRDATLGSPAGLNFSPGSADRMFRVDGIAMPHGSIALFFRKHESEGDLDNQVFIK